MADSENTGGLQFTDLPADIHMYLLKFIEICDILNLGSTCKHFYKLIRSNSIWKSRFKTTIDHLTSLLQSKSCKLGQASDEVNVDEDDDGVWKELYLRSCYAVSFARGNTAIELSSEDDGCTIYPYGGDRYDIGQEPNPSTIEVWVKLNHDNPGGVIIGCQSRSIRSGLWPQYHWQIMHVGPDGCIRGAIQPYYHLKGPMINDNRWHHIALTTSTNGYLKMFVDGILVDELNDPDRHEGTALHHAAMMDFCQLGIGCISYGELTPYDQNAMPPGHCGWYTFHGLVREVRFWSGMLSESDVKERMHIQRIDLLADKFSKHHKLIGYWPLTKLVSGLNCELKNDLVHLHAVCIQDKQQQIPLNLTRVSPP